VRITRVYDKTNVININQQWHWQGKIGLFVVVAYKTLGSRLKACDRVAHWRFQGEGDGGNRPPTHKVKKNKMDKNSKSEEKLKQTII